MLSYGKMRLRSELLVACSTALVSVLACGGGGGGPSAGAGGESAMSGSGGRAVGGQGSGTAGSSASHAGGSAEAGSGAEAGTGAEAGSGGEAGSNDVGGSAGRSAAGGAGMPGAGSGGAPNGGAATGGAANGGGSGASMVTLNGAAAKGPFIIGTTVNVTPVDASGNPGGNTFPTQTDDDVGNFSVQFSYQGAVQLEATGQWYDEVTGNTETAPLTLRGLASVSAAGTQHAYINPVTHLTYSRVKTLMAGGKSLTDSVTQAEGELRTQFVVGSTGFNPNATGTQLNLLGGDTDQAAYVFALSSISLLAAQAANNVTEQAFLNTAQSSFAPAGAVSASLVTAFNTAHPFVEPDYVMQALTKYFTQVSFAGTVPNINRVLDTDGDGIANINDDCVMIANANQTPVRGVCAYKHVALPTVQGSFYGQPIPLAADLDSDGDQDLIVVTLPTAYVYINDGAGNMTAKTFDLATALGIPNTGNPSIQILSAALGKVDADGHPDLVLSVSAQGSSNNVASLQLLPGVGDGTFGTPVQIWSNQPAGCVQAAQTCVLGGAACCTGTCMQLGPSNYQCFSAGPGSGPGPLALLQLADLNNDNKLDIVASSTSSQGGAPGNNTSTLAAVLLNPGASGWAAPTYLKVGGSATQGVNVNSLVVGNFTADTKPDILALVSPSFGGASLATAGVYLMTGDGSGGFSVGTPSTISDNCTISLAAGDFDEDGKLDVGLIDQGATKLTVGFGVGDGTFTAVVSAPVGPGTDAGAQWQ